MRRETPFTLEEAKDYIEKAVEEWGLSSQKDKIISLAGYVYNRNNKASIVSTAAKLKQVQTIINGLDKDITRMMKLDMDVEYEPLAATKSEYEKLATDLVEQLEKNPPVKRNVNTGKIIRRRKRRIKKDK